jgi:two-component system NtrC family response regulator
MPPYHTLKDIREKVELEVVQKALIKNAWNISKTAEELNISRPTLHELISKYKIKVRRQ